MDLSQKGEEQASNTLIDPPKQEQTLMSPEKPQQNAHSDEEDEPFDPQLTSSQHQQPQLQSDFKQLVYANQTSLFLTVFLGRKMELYGKMQISNKSVCYFFDSKYQKDEKFFELPISAVSKVERNIEDKAPNIEILTKYGFIVRVRFENVDPCHRTFLILNQLTANPTQLAVEYGKTLPPDLKCKKVPFPYAQTNEAPEYDNSQWKKMPLYPQRFIVPVPYLSKSGSDQRLVVLSFKLDKDVTVWRTGPGRPDPLEEQWLGKSRLANSRFHTIEIKNKGLGTGKSMASRLIEVESLSQLKDALHAQLRASQHNHCASKWLGLFKQTHWLQQICILLQEASLLANRLLTASSHTVTILADNDVRGAQLTALVQVLLFPECRGVEGLAQLMEREFLSWGCSFGKKEADLDKGTVIIQFLDCIFQLTCIYPLSFEFSQGLLVFIAEQVYSGLFGNFLLASRQISSQKRSIVQSCGCVWQHIQRRWSVGEPTWVNPFFVHSKQCDIYELKDIPSPKDMRIWNGFFFCQWGRFNNSDYHIYLRYQQLFAQHYTNKQETADLRQQLSQQHQLLMKRKARLKELKELE